jgi:hypothetical protein
MIITLDRSREDWLAFQRHVDLQGKWVTVKSSRRVTPDKVVTEEGYGEAQSGGIVLTLDDGNEMSVIVGWGAIRSVEIE